MPWDSTAELLVRIHMRDAMYDAAWSVARIHGVPMAIKQVLARETEATHSREALEVYAERVDQLVNAGGNRAYVEAAEIIGRMAGLRSATEQTAYVTTLEERFSRKRNFLKLLR